MGKGENAGNQHFLISPQCFLPIPERISVFKLHFCLSFANALNLDQSKDLLSGKELIPNNLKTNKQTNKKPGTVGHQHKALQKTFNCNSERKLLCIKGFHQIAAIFSAILETMSCRKPNFELFSYIYESDACIKYAQNLMRMEKVIVNQRISSNTCLGLSAILEIMACVKGSLGTCLRCINDNRCLFVKESCPPSTPTLIQGLPQFINWYQEN